MEQSISYWNGMNAAHYTLLSSQKVKKMRQSGTDTEDREEYNQKQWSKSSNSIGPCVEIELVLVDW